MDGPEMNILRKVRERQASYRVSSMRNLQRMIQKNVFTKQKQTHRHRKQTCGDPRGRGGEKWGAWDSQVHTTECKRRKQQGPMPRKGNGTQHLVITYKGKNRKKKRYVIYILYIYIKLSGSAVYLKLTQHCKSTIHQLKKPHDIQRPWGNGRKVRSELNPMGKKKKKKKILKRKKWTT